MTVPPDDVLAAVHQSLPLIRRGGTPEPADDRAALDALLAPDPPGGCAVVALVGPAGSGKSQLLRWLGLQLSERHQVVRLTGTVTRDTLLSELGVAAAEPSPPPPALDEASATDQLLEHIRTALRQRAADARAACDAAAQRGERPPAEERAVAETHGDGLLALLDGPTRDALLRETPRRKSVLRALVRALAAGVAGTAEFGPADFEFADVNSARLPDPKAQRYVAKLKTNLQGERAAAAALMNAALGAMPVADRAEPTDPLARVREDWFVAGRELVLLIDDYTRGEGQGVLDALAATGGPGRCAARVAVTAADDPALPGAAVFALGEGAALPAAVEDLVAAWDAQHLFAFTQEPLPPADADGRLIPGRVLRDAFTRAELEPAAEPEPPTPEPAPVAPPVEVDAALGALAVRLGRLPVPAPDDVIRFLAAAHTTGADLDLLTPGVVEWLRAHGLAASFRVRAGSSEPGA